MMNDNNAHQTFGVLSEDDPAAVLAAQIRARIDPKQAGHDDQGNHSAEVSAELFCNEEELAYARALFRDEPAAGTFSRVLAAELMMAAQKCVASPLLSQSGQSAQGRIHSRVAIFETVAFFWSAVSFDAREMIRHEIEQDRSAINATVLAGFSAATSIMRQKWRDFYPERYALSRLFLYPADHQQAAGLFLGVMIASQGLRLPMSQNEIRKESASNGLGRADAAVAGWVKWVDEAVRPGVCSRVAEMVQHYLAG